MFVWLAFSSLSSEVSTSSDGDLISRAKLQAGKKGTRQGGSGKSQTIAFGLNMPERACESMAVNRKWNAPCWFPPGLTSHREINDVGERAEMSDSNTDPAMSKIKAARRPLCRDKAGFTSCPFSLSLPAPQVLPPFRRPGRT